MFSESNLGSAIEHLKEFSSVRFSSKKVHEQSTYHVWSQQLIDILPAEDDLEKFSLG